ncbi:MAG: hypothetical protein WBJ19_17165, partial [Rhodoferax sp.]
LPWPQAASNRLNPSAMGAQMRLCMEDRERLGQAVGVQVCSMAGFLEKKKALTVARAGRISSW